MLYRVPQTRNIVMIGINYHKIMTTTASLRKYVVADMSDHFFFERILPVVFICNSQNHSSFQIQLPVPVNV